MIDLQTLTAHEIERQRTTLNLIASENYPSPAVMQLLGSVWSNKYAEGYPGKRYYAGNVYTDELESFVQAKALQLFDPTGEYGVNVQVLSGSPANAMVYLAALGPGDTIMGLKLENGGHLSHLHATSSWKKFFKHVTYDVTSTKNGYEIDVADFRHQLEETSPKLVIIGFSAYPRRYEFAPLIEAAHAAGALVLADIAHINGLVAADLHDSPFKAGSAGADFVTMTTHKTLRGPRGAMLFAKNEWIGRINKTVFPGTSGGPHLHQIAATGQALLEALNEATYPDGRSFRDYSTGIIENCQALEAGLIASGLEVVSPSQTHLTLIRLPGESDSLELQRRLEQAGIITNRNQVPNDPKTPWRPSGLRVGTAALTSRGLNTEQSYGLGRMTGALIYKNVSDEAAATYVRKMAESLAWPYS